MKGESVNILINLLLKNMPRPRARPAHQRQLLHLVRQHLRDGQTVSDIAGALGLSYNRIADLADQVARNFPWALGAGNQAGHDLYGTPIAPRADHQNNPFSSLPNPFFSGATMTNDSMNVDREQGAGEKVAVVSHYNSAARVKSKRAVHVSKTLSKKINKVIQQKELHKGSYVRVDEGQWFSMPTSGKQYVFDGFLTNTDAGVSGEGGAVETPWSFSPEYFLHCAAVLWNNKPDTTSKNCFVAASTNFNQAGLEFVVKTSKTEYLLKNHSGRVVNLKIYACRPKKVGTLAFNYTNTAGDPSNCDTQLSLAAVSDSGILSWTTAAVGTAALDHYQATLTPHLTWYAGLLQDYSQHSARTSVETLNYPGTVPTANNDFNTTYATECTEVVLEPGQSFNYVVHGPKNFDFRMQEHFNASGVWQNVQKYMVCPMVVATLDMARTSDTVGVGRIGDDKPVLGYNRTDSCVLSMPDQTGFSSGELADLPAVLARFSSKHVFLDKRKPVKAYYWYQAGAGTVIDGHVPGDAEHQDA